MVCKLQLLVVLIIAVVCQGRNFQYPALVDQADPKVISFKNSYYMVTTDEASARVKWFPIYQSEDLQNWELISHVFNEDNQPGWTSPYTLHDPYLHFSDGYFYLFYRGNEYNTNQQKIGVAKSRSIAGPYVTEPRPLALQGTGDVYTPAIIEDNTNGDTYFLWTQYDSKTMWGQKINLADLTLSESEATRLLRSTLPWENYDQAPSLVYRNGFYYIFYNSHFTCISGTAVGVARSKFPLGPYEKLMEPIIRDVSKSYGYPSVVQDVDASSDVLFYQGNCYPSMVNASTIVWGSDGWPSVSLE